MKTRALFALATLALCLVVLAGPATADQTATATLTTNGTTVGSVHIEGAPQGVFTVWEFTGQSFTPVGTGVVGQSGIANVAVAILYSPTPIFQVRLRTGDGVIVIGIPEEPDPHWWWD